jgi:hypothetical protein
MKASGNSCIQGVCTPTSYAPVSSCPFGDDEIVNSELQQVLSFLSLPNLPSSIMSCEAALSYYASSGFSITGLCSDSRSSSYFSTTCCSTCKSIRFVFFSFL